MQREKVGLLGQSLLNDSNSGSEDDWPLSGPPLLETLARHGRERHPGSDTVAALAPEEAARVPMLQRGVTLALLRRLVRELQARGRGDVDCGQFLNGVHTTDSATDWREFDRARDAHSAKACCLHTGTSFVETCMAAGLTHDPDTGAPYFGAMDTFVSYTWRSDPPGAFLCSMPFSHARGHTFWSLYSMRRAYP